MLGRVTKRQAEMVLRHVESLVASRAAGLPLDESSAKWLTKVGDRLLGGLERAGLVEGGARLGAVVERYKAMKRKAVKPSTMARLEQAMRAVVDELGEGRRMAAVTEAEAIDLRAKMIERGLAEATIRKQCQDMRGLWDYAVKAKLVTENPFVAVPVSAVAREDHVHVDRAASLAVLDELPNARWRALWALARWGGLRVPSEPRELKIGDVVLRGAAEEGLPTMTVTDVKRSRGKATTQRTRVVPLFEEVEGPLAAAIAELPAGEERVFPWLVGMQGDSVRKPLIKAIKRAGLTVWPDLWRNVRSTRERELHDYLPADVASTIMGNTEAVAKRHYLRMTEANLRRALDGSMHTLVHTENLKSP